MAPGMKVNRRTPRKIQISKVMAVAVKKARESNEADNLGTIGKCDRDNGQSQAYCSV